MTLSENPHLHPGYPDMANATLRYQTLPHKATINAKKPREI
ncbi:hypothetical protein PN480_04390 [Dolichospermum circinale CS-1225]|nr:hypothetical protein [Dolichospermum circinale]MDB9468989.1 hypothetical protein [Dolichospermum circinale CS-539/09]MDB9469141.1 hypothetical protein [Dolichospermum circinale CS-539]MDB9521196.1 hypothetical protein [Dolichospermum circinale CS-1225]